jgi:hypothetical protein
MNPRKWCEYLGLSQGTKKIFDRNAKRKNSEIIKI